MPGRFNLEPAYILHRKEYRDTSLLLDVWSRNQGRIALVARGARGPKTRFQNLQPFQRLLLSWSGRGELANLTDAEPEGAFLKLSAQLIISGFYLNELLTLLLHKHDPLPELFTHYERAINTLSKLSNAQCSVTMLQLEEQKALRLFEKNMLEVLGYGIRFDLELASARAITADAWYEYTVTNGFSLTAKKNGRVYPGKHLLSIDAEELNNSQVLKDAKHIMRMTLDYHLGGRVLRSRELRLAMAKKTKINH